MIVKVVAAKSGSRASFMRLAAYIADAPRDGEKVVGQDFNNCFADSISDAELEIKATQSLCTGTKVDKTYHMIVSFETGERPGTAVLADIEKTLAESVGLGEHQRISAVHDDTSHMHIHIAINKVHPETHRIFTPFRDFPKLQKAARALELKHGLSVLKPEPAKSRRSDKATDFEAHTKAPTFNQWAKETLLEPLQSALQDQTSGWQGFQEVLANNGLIIKPRGRGLIITTGNGRLYVKPSEISRNFSKAALEKQLGPFKAIPLKVKRCPYRAQPSKGPKNNEIYNEYQQYRKDKGSFAELKAASSKQFAGEYQERKQELIDPVMTAWREKKRKLWRDPLLSKRQKYRITKVISLELTQQLAEPRAELEILREEIRDQSNVLSWTNYLIREAQKGDTRALAVLIRSSHTSPRMIGNILVGLGSEKERPIIPIDGTMPKVHKNGDMSYGRGNQRFIVGANGIHVYGHDDRVISQALEYATRLYGKNLVIKGDEAFMQSVQTLIQSNKLDLRIAEQGLQR